MSFNPPYFTNPGLVTEAEECEVYASSLTDHWGRLTDAEVLRAHDQLKAVPDITHLHPDSIEYCSAAKRRNHAEYQLEKKMSERDFYMSMTKTIRAEIGEIITLNDMGNMYGSEAVKECMYTAYEKNIHAMFAYNRLMHSIVLKVVSLMQREYPQDITPENRWKLITDLRRRHTLWEGNPE